MHIYMCPMSLCIHSERWCTHHNRICMPLYVHLCSAMLTSVQFAKHAHEFTFQSNFNAEWTLCGDFRAHSLLLCDVCVRCMNKLHPQLHHLICHLLKSRKWKKITLILSNRKRLICTLVITRQVHVFWLILCRHRFIITNIWQTHTPKNATLFSPFDVYTRQLPSNKSVQIKWT